MPGSIARWEEVRRAVAALGRAQVRAGIVGEDAHRKHEGSDLTIGALALILHEGNPRTNLPPRPFVRETLEMPEVQAEFAALEARLTGAVIAGSMSRDVALAELGSWIARKIRQRILDGEIRPPLAQRTVEKKGHSTPLLETHQLVNAIGYEIEK